MRPMLAATLEDVATVRFPVLASPKLDGIRCLMINGVAYSRNMKPIRNRYIQEKLDGLDGLDGELIVGEATGDGVFQRTSSGVMSEDGRPNFMYYVFDSTVASAMPFQQRLEAASRAVLHHPKALIVTHKKIISAAALTSYECQQLLRGFEGIMLRDPIGPYKHGRSTLREGWLTKLKRFENGEAVVVGTVEQMHNANPATKDELGRTKRSSAKSGKQATGKLGALAVRDLETGCLFEIGTGFADDQRVLYWRDRKRLLGRIAKYKSQPTGVKDKPRFPVFLGFRELDDM